MNKEQIDEIAVSIWSKTPYMDEPCGAKAFTHALLTELAKGIEPVKRHFECWSTNEGDSWYEHPADTELLYEVLGDEPKVGDEFEVMAGWISVQARYRISSKMNDDFEVECISHPEDNIPQPDLVDENERLKAEHSAMKAEWDKAYEIAMLAKSQLSAAQASEGELLTELEKVVAIMEYTENEVRFPCVYESATKAIAAHKARKE